MGAQCRSSAATVAGTFRATSMLTIGPPPEARAAAFPCTNAATLPASNGLRPPASSAPAIPASTSPAPAVASQEGASAWLRACPSGRRG